jgi:hypothetical protein
LTALFGERTRIAAEVGKRWQKHHQLRRVDLWAGGRHLTCDDNTVFVPQFIVSVEASIAAIRDGSIAHAPIPADDARRKKLGGAVDQPLFPAWGPTTDNILGVLARTASPDRLELLFEFCRPTHPIVRERGVVFAVELAAEELIAVLSGVVEALRSDATA